MKVINNTVTTKTRDGQDVMWTQLAIIGDINIAFEWERTETLNIKERIKQLKQEYNRLVK